MTKSKISGGYVNGIMAHDQAKRNGCHEAILLDTTGFVAEGSGQNIFNQRWQTIHSSADMLFKWHNSKNCNTNC